MSKVNMSCRTYSLRGRTPTEYSFQRRPATLTTEAVKGYYKIKLGKKLKITYLPNEERLVFWKPDVL